jgi:glycosyltransferase involved in cell wall biosynthesis
MRVLILNQFFHPDVAPTGQLAADLAEDLVAAGHQVRVVTGRGGYAGGGRLLRRETWRGIEIERVYATTLGKGTLPRRLAGYATFYLAAAWRLLTGPRADVVLVMSTPPLIASTAALLRRWRGVPFVYWVQDVYPELAVAFGVLRAGGAAGRAFDLAARFTLRSADAVVVLGEAMARRLETKGVSRGRLAVIPNWADGRAVHPLLAEDNSFRRDHGLDGQRVVLYSGNMGRAHDVETILRLARGMRDRKGVTFLFIGDGHLRGEVEAASRELPNVRLLPYQRRDDLARSLSAGDVHVVTQRPETLGLLEPSKFYGAMAVGRPVLYLGPAGSEVGRTIQDEAAGEVVAPGDLAGAQAALERLLAEPEQGVAARRAAFEARYDRPHRTAALGRILGEAARGAAQR